MDAFAVAIGAVILRGGDVAKIVGKTPVQVISGPVDGIWAAADILNDWSPA